MSKPHASRRTRALVVVALIGALGVVGWLWPRAAPVDDSAADPRGARPSLPTPRPSTIAGDALTRATVWVEVVSVEGDPVAGASVTLKAAAGARAERTDEAGIVTFASLLPGPYTVDVAAAGYEPLSTREVLRPGLAEAAWTLRLHVDDASDALRGVVVSSGEPVAGALVTTLVGGQAREDGAVKSGADGRFVIPRPTDASAVIAFHAQHGVGELTLSEAREVVVELPSPGYVEGRVSDDKGRALSSFRVQVRVTELPAGLTRALAAAHGGGREGRRAVQRQLTHAWVDFPAGDDDEAPGSFRVGPVPAGVVRVVASAEGRVPAEREASVSSGGVARGVSLSLSGPLVVAGCVVDAEGGAPVRGARIHAMRTEAPDAPGFGFATTDDDGCYRLLTTAGVRHSVSASARGYVATSVGGVLGRADDEVRRDFTLERSSGRRGEGYRYVGVGAKLKLHDDGAQVVGVFASGSAAGALVPGDVILRVDGVWTEGTPLARIVEMIVGEDGTEVELLVQPKGGGPVKTVVLSRRQQSSSG